MHPTSGIAEVNGTRLYYESRGSGLPLLFLHGFTLDHRMWRPQVDALATKYRVVTYDARGFGGSALPGAEAYKHCDDAAALCKHLGLERVVAVGHSIGGHQMLEFALTHQAIVAGFVGVALSGLASVPFPDDVMKMFAALRQTARDSGVEAAKRIWSEGGWFESAREVPALASEIDVMLGDYSGWHWTHDNPAQNIVPPAADRLGSLHVPALVVTGARDLAYNTAIAEKLVAGIPNANWLHVESAGHMVNMEAPQAVNGAIAEFAEQFQA